MKKVKTWLLIIGLAGPSVVNFSCLSAAQNKIWNAAVDGASDAVNATVSTLVVDAMTGVIGG